MGNDTEKNQQNPGQRPGNPANQPDPNQPDPSQSGKHVYNPQDPTTKKPGQDSGTTHRPDREGSEDVEKRRASWTGARSWNTSHGESAVASLSLNSFSPGDGLAQRRPSGRRTAAMLYFFISFALLADGGLYR